MKFEQGQGWKRLTNVLAFILHVQENVRFGIFEQLFDNLKLNNWVNEARWVSGHLSGNVSLDIVERKNITSRWNYMKIHLVFASTHLSQSLCNEGGVQVSGQIEKLKVSSTGENPISCSNS